MELQRRKWPTLEVGPLEEWRKRDIVQAFLKRSMTGRFTEEPLSPPNNTGDVAGIGIAQSSSTFLTGIDFLEGAPGSSSFVTGGGPAGGGIGGRVPGGTFRLWREPGLVLFPSMVERIVSR